MTALFNNVFTEQRAESDICYVDIITNILSKLKHPTPNNWFVNLKNAQEIKAAHPKLQRFLINRALRLSIGLLPVDTTAVRYCLVDNCPDIEYLDIFEQVVAPVMVQYQL